MYSKPGVFLSLKEWEPGTEIARSARQAMVTILLGLLLLLPEAWCATKGYLPTSMLAVLCGGAMMMSAFLTQRLFTAKGREGVIDGAISGVIEYLLLLLMSAGLHGAKPAPIRTLPYAGCALVGFVVGPLTKMNKKCKTRNRARRRYYR